MAEDLKTTNKTTNTIPAQDWLEAMPANIREWLGSNALLYLIVNLNRRLGLEGIKSAVVPDLILQIAVKELRPKDLPEKLTKELGISREMAFNITKEIEEKMLRPIEVPLRSELGVDIKEIYVEKPAPLPNRIPPSAPIYKPQAPSSPTPAILAKPVPIPPPVPPRPATPINPLTPPAQPVPVQNEVPVKINVKPAQPIPVDRPKPANPFGDDSWINKLK